MNDFMYNFIKDIMMSTLSVETHKINTQEDDISILDHGIMKILWNDFDYNSYKSLLYNLEENYLYYLQNTLEQNIVFMKFPNESDLLILGPYLIEDVSLSFFERILLKNKISDSASHALKSYYSTLPVIDEMKINKSIHTIASYIMTNYCEENVKHIIMNDDLEYQLKPTTLLNYSMKILEERYKNENKLLNAISIGDYEEAIKYLGNMFKANLPSRVDNQIRNLKNYIFIINTLYRKAAEQGKVHPVYLDEISSKYAVQIERINDINQLYNLVYNMTNKYCMLVKNNSLSKYSHLIRKTINYIKINISSPLSLKILAENYGINASYLSAQFKKETDQTLTEFIHQERVNAAIQLLNTTELPIQEIAYRVGIEDQSYFAKLFRKQVGMSPLQYSSMMHKDV